MKNRRWLMDGFLVGFSTLIVGGTAFLIPAGDSRAVLVGGVAGASTGAALLAKRRDDRCKEEKFQFNQVVSSLAKLEDLTTAVKAQIDQLQCQSQGSVKKSLQARKYPISEDSLSEVDDSITSPMEVIGEQNSESASEAIAWLNERNMNVESYRHPQEVDIIFDRLAMFLGNRYLSLKPLYNQIKINLGSGAKFRLRLAERSKEDIANCTQFCQMLHDSSFLSYYRYFSEEKVIIATPQTRGDMINFFNGGWFERFVYRQVSDLLSSNGLRYECLINPLGIFANGDDWELDLLFLLDGQPLWIECKSGKDYNSYLQRYSSHRKKLAISPEMAFLVILDIPDHQAADLTNLWDITVVNQSNFISRISTVLGLPDSQEPQQCNQPVTITPGNLLTFLKKKSLRPLPEEREVAIGELINLFVDLQHPIALSQVEDILAEKLQISKSKLHDILNAVVRSDCLLDDSGQIVRSYTLPVSALVSLDPVVLEKKCIESYAFAILTGNPNYFDNPHNISEFEQTIGGKIPDAETIDQIKVKILNEQ